MKKLTFLLFICCIGIKEMKAQTLVTDPSNEGQLKRLVYDQWDDWQPDPGTHFFGIIPNNIYGWFWWRVVNPEYYHGEDKRPYRADGPFPSNLASLALQNQDDQRIMDTSDAVKDTHLATYTNMAGDVFDTPYDIYFKEKFHQLTNIELDNITKLGITNPLAYQRLMASKVYSDYMEILDVQSSRIEANHQAFVEKGERIITYLEIKKQLEFSNKVIENYIVTYLKSTIVPPINSIPNNTLANGHYPNTDAEIVNYILSHFQY